MEGKFRDILYAIRKGLLSALVGPVLLGGLAIANRVLYNKTIDKPTYHLVSHAKGIAGRTEYVKYRDGSQEFRNLSILRDEYNQDINGDGVVDRIRGYRGVRHRGILVREEDYTKYQKEFDEADRELEKLSRLEK